MTRSAAQRSVPDEDQPMSNGCPQVQAMDRQTAAMDRLVAEIAAAREAFTPAAEAVAGLGQAQEKLCSFIVTNRLKIMLGGIGALVAVGAISPAAADAIRTALHAAGAM